MASALDRTVPSLTKLGMHKDLAPTLRFAIFRKLGQNPLDEAFFGFCFFVVTNKLQRAVHARPNSQDRV